MTKNAPGSIDIESLPAILTVDEVALLLRMNRKTIYEAINQNRIPGVTRIGRLIRVSRDAVVAWLQSGDLASPAATGVAAVTGLTAGARGPVLRSRVQGRAVPGGF